MTKVDSCHVEEIQVEIYDTLSEELLEKRYAAVFVLNGVEMVVRGRYPTSVQVEIARTIQENTERAEEEKEKAS